MVVTAKKYIFTSVDTAIVRTLGIGDYTKSSDSRPRVGCLKQRRSSQIATFPVWRLNGTQHG